MSKIRTFTLHEYTAPDPDGPGETVSDRALKVTVGTQALEPGVHGGKTLIRFQCCPLPGKTPRMRIDVEKNGNVPPGQLTGIESFRDAECVELQFDNESFCSEAKEMPFWLIEGLEFAAKKLREEYSLNQEGGLNVEETD